MHKRSLKGMNKKDLGRPAPVDGGAGRRVGARSRCALRRGPLQCNARHARLTSSGAGTRGGWFVCVRHV